MRNGSPDQLLVPVIPTDTSSDELFARFSSTSCTMTEEVPEEGLTTDVPTAQSAEC